MATIKQYSFYSNEDISIKLYFKSGLEWYEQLSEHDIYVHFKVDIIDNPPIIEASTVLGNIAITDDDAHEATISLAWDDYKDVLALYGTWLFDGLLINKSPPYRRRAFEGGILQLRPTVTRGNANE